MIVLATLRRHWPALVLAALIVALGWLIRDYGKTEYRRGHIEGSAVVQKLWDAERAEQIAAARKQAEANAAAAHAASTEYQQEQAHDKQQTRVIRETVVQYVDRPVYRDRQCLDDGLLDNINAAIAGKPASR